MSFTVEDFHDLIELLAQHPEWRAELRRHVLSDDLIELPTLVRQLVEAQSRSEARLEGVEGRMDRVEAAIDRLTDAQARTEARVTELVEAQARTEARLAELAEAQTRTEAHLGRVDAHLGGLDARLGRVENRLGSLDGKMLELDYARRAPSYFSAIARRLHVIEHGALAELLDDAVDDDRLTIDERDEILRANLVMSGRQRQNNQDVYLVAELSVGVGPHDVERVAARAALLTKLGKPALPVVAGETINHQAATLAQEQGVWYAEGGRITAPRGA